MRMDVMRSYDSHNVDGRLHLKKEGSLVSPRDTRHYDMTITRERKIGLRKTTFLDFRKTGKGWGRGRNICYVGRRRQHLIGCDVWSPCASFYVSIIN